jgi:hypothetical protein
MDKKLEEDLEGLTEDEIETLLILIRLDLAGDLNLDCKGCPGDAGCC